MASISLLLSLLSLLFPLISSSTTTTIPLSIHNPTPFSDPYQKLTHLATTSLARAQHIKNPKQSNSVSTTPVSPRSYGGYSISLSFGTPPQSIPFILDTGSNLVWFPCTKRYVCKSCSANNSSSVPIFIPKMSSSAKLVGCMNPKCGWIHGKSSPQSRCQDCQTPNSADCNQICPPYLILYGSGTTGGLAMVETLDLQNKKIQDFFVGCSLFSSHQPAGIAGFGRGIASFPNQLGVKRFSYCLLSHSFDDSEQSTSLVLDGSSDSSEKTANLTYTPLLKNPVVEGRAALSVYYFIGLRKITVGGVKVKIPYKYLAPDLHGNGGTIVDSGTTFTYLNRDVHEIVVKAFVEQVKGHKRDEGVEQRTGLRPCFDVSGGGSGGGWGKKVVLPEMKLHFKGGAEMALPLANYFSFVGESEVVCLTMISDDEEQDLSAGPSVILGNYQMQNYNVEYDLRNQRFGFRQQVCK